MKYLFTADWHVRPDTDIPICRSDNFFAVQKETLEFISKIAKSEDAIIFVAGDVFHKSRPDKSQELEIMLIDIFKDDVIFLVAGNHDLPYHRLKNIEKSSLGVLIRQDNWFLLGNQGYDLNYESKGFSWGEKIIDYNGYGDKLVVIHKYCEIDSIPEYISDGITSKELLNKYKYDVFVVGDNHKAFVDEDSGRFVFNPGCITRQAIDKRDYKPVAYLYDPVKRNYDTIFLPDNSPSSMEYNPVKEVDGKNEDINSFISVLSNKRKEFSIDFEQNIRDFLKKNKVSEKVKEKIWLMMEG